MMLVHGEHAKDAVLALRFCLATPTAAAARPLDPDNYFVVFVQLMDSVVRVRVKELDQALDRGLVCWHARQEFQVLRNILFRGLELDQADPDMIVVTGLTILAAALPFQAIFFLSLIHI